MMERTKKATKKETTSKKSKKEIQRVPVEIEFTEGYEQRFTKAILKIYGENIRAELSKAAAEKQGVV